MIPPQAQAWALSPSQSPFSQGLRPDKCCLLPFYMRECVYMHLVCLHALSVSIVHLVCLYALSVSACPQCVYSALSVSTVHLVCLHALSVSGLHLEHSGPLIPDGPSFQRKRRQWEPASPSVTFRQWATLPTYVVVSCNFASWHRADLQGLTVEHCEEHPLWTYSVEGMPTNFKT